VAAARLRLAAGSADLALRELDVIEVNGDGEPDPEVAAIAAAAHAECGADARAAQLLDRAREGHPPVPAQVSWLLVEAAREVRHRDSGRALMALHQSLRLAEPEALRRPFREADPTVRRLLSANPRLLAGHRWLRQVAPLAGRTVEPAPAPARLATTGGGAVVEPLTVREREVLGHLEELLTTDEIAEKMFVSVNTVRTHVRGILRKLGVNRRNAAVRRARELGILDT
jgi:LuxR family maltose regulon positive regulatory protein